MRVIARSALAAFWQKNPDAKTSLERWHAIVARARWTSMDEVQQAFANAKVLNAERVRFAIAGNRYRLICAFNFRAQIAFVKFVGTHAAYDKIDALTISQQR